MADLLSDPRLRSLLDEADRSLDVLRDPTPAGRSSDEAMRTLDILHRDIGRRVHDLWQLELRVQGGRAELELEPVVELEPLDDLAPLDDADELAVITDAVPLDEPPGLWVDDLQDLLALLDAPSSDADAVALAIETTRIQWATVGLNPTWRRFPEPIQVALLGMLAARCRFLMGHLACDLGPRAALGRLARYRSAAGLATVTGLVADQDPESGSWTDDALHWWDMLTAGIQA